MEQSELLRQTTAALTRLGIPHFVTGGLASIFYGEPRFTNDIDIVVDLPADKIAALCASFSSEEFYLSPEAVSDAVARRRQFNILHPASGLKVDIMMSSGDEFDRGRFARRRELSTSPEHQVSFASPEDVILKKLLYFREGGSDKHLRDIAGILRVSGSALDQQYLAEWAERLGVADLWRHVLERGRG